MEMGLGRATWPHNILIAPSFRCLGVFDSPSAHQGIRVGRKERSTEGTRPFYYARLSITKSLWHEDKPSIVSSLGGGNLLPVGRPCPVRRVSIAIFKDLRRFATGLCQGSSLLELRACTHFPKKERYIYKSTDTYVLTHLLDQYI